MESRIETCTRRSEADASDEMLHHIENTKPVSPAATDSNNVDREKNLIAALMKASYHL
jgi:hypothetical protein